MGAMSSFEIYVVHQQRGPTLRSICHCGGAHHLREPPHCRHPRWSFSRTLSATFPCWRGGRLKTSWSVSDSDGSVFVCVGSMIEVGAADMCSVCDLASKASLLAQVDRK